MKSIASLFIVASFIACSDESVVTLTGGAGTGGSPEGGSNEGGAGAGAEGGASEGGKGEGGKSEGGGAQVGGSHQGGMGGSTGTAGTPALYDVCVGLCSRAMSCDQPQPAPDDVVTACEEACKVGIGQNEDGPCVDPTKAAMQCIETSAAPDPCAAADCRDELGLLLDCLDIGAGNAIDDSI